MDPVKTAVLVICGYVAVIVVSIIFGWVGMATTMIDLVALIMIVIGIPSLFNGHSVIMHPEVAIIFLIGILVLGYITWHSRDVVIWSCRLIGSLPKIQQVNQL